MAMTSDQREAARLRQAFAAAPQTALHDRFAFSWWRHGGEPGPDWLSDKLELAPQDGQIAGIYTRARADPTPPFQVRSQAFYGPVPEPLVVGLLSAIFEARLFEAELPSEHRGNLMDAVRQDFDLTLTGSRLQKVLSEPAPDELGGFPGACDAITRQLTERGRRRELAPATPR